MEKYDVATIISVMALAFGFFRWLFGFFYKKYEEIQNMKEQNAQKNFTALSDEIKKINDNLALMNQDYHTMTEKLNSHALKLENHHTRLSNLEKNHE